MTATSATMAARANRTRRDATILGAVAIPDRTFSRTQLGARAAAWASFFALMLLPASAVAGDLGGVRRIFPSLEPYRSGTVYLHLTDRDWPSWMRRRASFSDGVSGGASGDGNGGGGSYGSGHGPGGPDGFGKSRTAVTKTRSEQRVGGGIFEAGPPTDISRGGSDGSLDAGSATGDDGLSGGTCCSSDRLND